MIIVYMLWNFSEKQIEILKSIVNTQHFGDPVISLLGDAVRRTDFIKSVKGLLA